jgi:hypothetical protein
LLLARSDQEPIEYHSAAARLPKQKEEDEEPTSGLPSNFFDSSAKKKAVRHLLYFVTSHSEFRQPTTQIWRKNLPNFERSRQNLKEGGGNR